MLLGGECISRQVVNVKTIGQAKDSGTAMRECCSVRGSSWGVNIKPRVLESIMKGILALEIARARFFRNCY